MFDKTLEYQGEKLQFTRWGANDARLFRAELEVAQQTFAAAIFDDLSNQGAIQHAQRVRLNSLDESSAIKEMRQPMGKMRPNPNNSSRAVPGLP